MSRVQLALNVSDLDAAVEFYSRLFATAPAKRHPDYANFTGALNHLGVEVETADEVARTSARLTGEGLETGEESGTTCCYALQDKVWVEDPDGAPWEVYTVLADAPVESGIRGDGTCCAVEDTASCC